MFLSKLGPATQCVLLDPSGRILLLFVHGVTELIKTLTSCAIFG